MSKYIGSEEKVVKAGEKLNLKNLSKSPVAVGTAVMFNEDGSYICDVLNGRVRITCGNQKYGTNMQDNPHWINRTEYGVTTYITDKDIECSECGHRQPKLFDMNFCPNCGADMRGETE